MTDDDGAVAYAVDRFGTASHTRVLESLLQGMDHDTLRTSVEEYGLEAVAERYLGAVVADGTVHGDEGAAEDEVERILQSDPNAAPRVHALTVADVADLMTRLGLTDPPSSDAS